MTERFSRSPYEGFDHLRQVQQELLKRGYYFFPVEREHVEGLVTDPLLARLRRTIKQRGFRKLAAHTAISFSGYASDPREIFEIPAIRAYYRQLDQALPELPALLTLLAPFRYNGPAIHLELLGTVNQVVERPELGGYHLRVDEAPAIIAAAQRRIQAAGHKYHLQPAAIRRLSEQFAAWALRPLQPNEWPPMSGGAPMKTYKGYSEDAGSAMGPEVFFVQPEGEPPYKLKHRVHHSPDGMAYGYGGSGPADLARSILWDHLGSEPPPSVYQEFKRAFVARWEQGKPWSITGEQIDEWIVQSGAQEKLDEHRQWLAEEEQLRRDIEREPLG